jgi:hypothetical protein
MTVGMSTVNTANAWLNVLRGNSAGVTFTAPAVQAAKLYVGDPGASGTANAAAGDTTRKALTFNAASGGSMGLTSAPASWTNGGTSETLTHIGVWDSTTAGNFQYSAALASSQAWNTGNSFTITSLSFALQPLAA